ncbi:MAG: hypothetical protein RLZZ618_1264 [Pseudomonadota bacterium]
MKWIFAVVGGILGSMLGDILGGLFGVGAGFALAAILEGRESSGTKPQSPGTAGQGQTRPASAAGLVTAPPPMNGGPDASLEWRISALEKEVGALRLQIAQMNLRSTVATERTADGEVQAPVATPPAIPETAALTLSLVPAEPTPSSVMAPALPAVNPLAVPATLSIPVPVRVPAPAPAKVSLSAPADIAAPTDFPGISLPDELAAKLPAPLQPMADAGLQPLADADLPPLAEAGLPPRATPAMNAEDELSSGPDTEPMELVPLAAEQAVEPAPAKAAVPGPVHAPAVAPVTPPKTRVPAPLTLQDRLPDMVRDWIFGGNTIVKLGVLILFLGLAFLLRFAAERVTVPVEVRYAGVALIGAVLLGLGWRLRNRKDAAGGSGYGLILQGAGIGVFYLTILAALKVNALLPPEIAFGLLFVVTVLSAILAVVQNASWLAYVAVAEGFLAPVLVSTGGGNHIALFTYMAILDIGILLMAWNRAWRPLNLIGFVGTFTLAGAWAQKHYTDALYPSMQGFLLLFFALFTLIGVLFARRALALGNAPQPHESLSQRAATALTQVGRVDSSLVFGVPLAAFSFQYLLVRDMPYGPAWSAFGFSLFYLLVGGLLMRRGGLRYALLGEAYVVVSVLFGTLTIPLALEAGWTGATWAIEAAGMYWLGQRQQRVYARAFATLVLTGAVVGILRVMGIDLRPDTPFLTGSVLTISLLALSALAMFNVNRRGKLDGGDGWEAAAGVGFLWTGMAAVTALPWMLLSPTWASVATAFIALASAVLHPRMSLGALKVASAALHGVALVGFVTTLHVVDGSPMLNNGWEGLTAAVLIGLALLATGWLSLQSTLAAAAASKTVPIWSVGSQLGLLAGLAMVSGSLLFVMPADQAARIWPWIGLAALWLGLRIRHAALGLAWAALQVASAIAFIAFGPSLWASVSAELTCWTPLGLTLVALLSGDAISRASRHPTAMVWVRTSEGQWAVVLWALGWWANVLLPDLYRHLAAQPEHLASWPVLLAAWVTFTSMAATGLARWRDWTVLGQTTVLTLPGWFLASWWATNVFGLLPHEQSGWFVWPLVLVWHAVLVRAQIRWLSESLLKVLHVAGLWFFVLLAAREVMGWFALGSLSHLLASAAVPALVLLVLTLPAVRERWPVGEFRTPYLMVGCLPLALYLVYWLWSSNLHQGDVGGMWLPLLNRLELAQGLVLFALWRWFTTEPMDEQQWLPDDVLKGALGAALFILYTGMVLRTCSHWADVPWSFNALFNSMVTQSALSGAWSLLGVALMVSGHRALRRSVWVAGATLLGVVVLKLFFVELADRGGIYRVVSFMGVGMLLLAVGYFAPVPPSRDDEASV